MIPDPTQPVDGDDSAIPPDGTPADPLPDVPAPIEPDDPTYPDSDDGSDIHEEDPA